ncbi:MAG: bifunctional hydroxymethylpyrimidine kinase/phosphomethylpyrimidine kinase [Bacteroides sp.]|nr:bifunctional hydroxymethylpyrimidine kinase/phosphomethylpyrimidine kinase [Eubacterium sp.]MCM1417781.1 bifunctional hydroxymethylpyrimidine kinase/phosphomethylpyrimidine kinase [Roseburia sp.]MCM1461328.1 bifunctional hydroxymethylpyrimidine kinase/phosphomethylpyrimidine kinase [Bacteroides sp.]
MKEIKRVLSIAGSDSGGGAGIQADVKTITAFGLYAETAVTALTAQNTVGVRAILNVPADFIGEQLDAVIRDLRPDSVKIGMTASAEAIRVIASKLLKYRLKNVVIDPVLVSSSGRRLLGEDAEEELLRTLLPLGTVVTPNLPEAFALCGVKAEDEAGMRRAAEELAKKLPGAILVKGGHLAGEAVDLLYREKKFTRFVSERVNTENSHGTGCTLSSAIACGLAEGLSVEESVKRAKAYLTGALRASLPFGQGAGPLNHMFAMKAFEG